MPKLQLPGGWDSYSVLMLFATKECATKREEKIINVVFHNCFEKCFSQYA